jgi:serine protease
MKGVFMKRIAILVTVCTMVMAVTTMVPPAGAASTAAAVSAAPAAAVSRLSDFNGDGFTDLVARDTAGRLWLYPGNGTGGFKARHLIGGGWNSMTAIFTPGDVTVDPQSCGVNLTCPPDGTADIIARDSVGSLLIYNGNGAGGLEGLARLGFYDGEFKGYTITNAADLNGTELPDVLARDSAGVLWVYPLRIFRDLSMGGGGWWTDFAGPRIRIGGGWNSYTFRGPGDSSGDGKADILARDSAGLLWLYPGNGTGRVTARTLVGSGWAGMTALVTPGNWDGAGGNDILARDSLGNLWLYPGNNAGGYGARRWIGGGWNPYTIS